MADVFTQAFLTQTITVTFHNERKSQSRDYRASAGVNNLPRAQYEEYGVGSTRAKNSESPERCNAARRGCLQWQ